MVFSCNKETLFSDDMDTTSLKLAREMIIAASENNVSVDEYQMNDDYGYLAFSNGEHIVFSMDSLVFMTIDLSGRWRIGSSSIFVPNPNKEQIEELVRTKKQPTRAGGLIGIEEGYTEWIFHFLREEPIKLVKTLYSYDADLIMRSVNHRGFSSEAPENMLEAYRLSRLSGFKHVETDVRFTSDGVPVLLHDKSIDRTSNGIGEIKNITFEEVRSYDFGEWKSAQYKGVRIPTLEEFLSLCAEIGLEPNIELKTGSKEQIYTIVDLVEEYGLTGKVTYIAFELKLLRYVLSKDPKARICLLASKVNKTVISNANLLITDDNFVYIGASDYSDEAVSLCRNSNIPLSVWVIDSKKEILSLPSYVSGVSSNSLHAGRVIYEARRAD